MRPAVRTLAASCGRPDRRHASTVRLVNSMGRPIGTVTVGSRDDGEASLVSIDLARHIYTPEGLADPDPFVAGAARAPRAQAIVERMIFRHPRLITLAMHLPLPGDGNVIAASNFGRIGKPADRDDARVISEGAILREATDDGSRLAVELPQKDAAGRTIGALSTSFALTTHFGAASAYGEAVALRDEIARATPSLVAITAAR